MHVNSSMKSPSTRSQHPVQLASSSGSSSASSPATATNTKVRQGEHRSPLSSSSSSSSLLPHLAQTKPEKSTCGTLLSSEYESVKDVRVVKPPSCDHSKDEGASQNEDEDISVLINGDGSPEQIKTADAHLFKSTITAFDILSERCSELLVLFENESDTGNEVPNPSSKNQLIK